jgi:aldose 1-epimerase
VIDGVEYHVLPNENNNNDTLHGGPDGWDWVESEHKCSNFC